MTGEWFPRRYENERYSRSQRFVEQPTFVWWRPVRERDVDPEIGNVLERAHSRWEISDERFDTEAECQARCDELNGPVCASSKEQASQTPNEEAA